MMVVTNLSEIKLVGIACRTNNKAEASSDSAKIGVTLQQYFTAKLSAQIENRKSTGKTYCVYTEYASDVNGDYTYFVGEEVSSFGSIATGMQHITIPVQTYAKFTSARGLMPDVCINLWHKIWNMSAQELQGERAYIADFEVYDERAIDFTNTELDVYVGIVNK